MQTNNEGGTVATDETDPSSLPTRPSAQRFITATESTSDRCTIL